MHKTKLLLFRFTERNTTPVRKQISWEVSGKHHIDDLKIFSRSLQKQGTFKY